MTNALQRPTLPRKVRATAWAALVTALGLLANACADTDQPAILGAPDRQMFDAEVWPLLVRDCGFSACHGDPVRFFHVLGPGHERLDPSMRLSAPVTEAELQISYDRSRSMIDPDDPGSSPLLRKPLEVAAGGSGHEGTDPYGRDIYPSTEDPRYRILYEWMVMTGAAP